MTFCLLWFIFSSSTSSNIPECKSQLNYVAVPQLTVDLLVKTIGGDLSPESRLKSLFSRLFSNEAATLPDIAAHIARALQVFIF